MDITIPLLTIIFPIIGGVIGYFIKASLDKKKDLISEVTKERRELYQKFIDLVIDIFKGTKTNHNQDKQFVSKLYDFYKKYVLYASPEVINSFSDYFQYLYSSNEENPLDHKIHFKKLTKIMISMRSDLGLSNNNLGVNGEKLLRALLTDFDRIMND